MIFQQLLEVNHKDRKCRVFDLILMSEVDKVKEVFGNQEHYGLEIKSIIRLNTLGFVWFL